VPKSFLLAQLEARQMARRKRSPES
jgi:hypothetical protein